MITIDEAVELLGRVVHDTGYPLELPRILRGGKRLHDAVVDQDAVVDHDADSLPDDMLSTDEEDES